MAKKILTAESLRERYYYDPEAGTFENRKRGTLAGCRGKGGLVLKIDGKHYLAHRLAWLYMTGDWPPEAVWFKRYRAVEDKTDIRWDNINYGSIA